MNDYEIGKGRPPVRTRFKPGNREYLKRNKSKTNQENEIFKKVMSEPIPVRKGSRVIYQSRMQIFVDRLFANALKGDIKAMELLVTVHRNAKEHRSLTPIFIWMTKEHEALL